MKLLSITNRYYFISVVLFFLFAGIILFYMINYHLKDELNEQLQNEKEHILEKLKTVDSLNPSSYILNANLIALKINANKTVDPRLYDTMMFDNTDAETIPYRAIQFSAKTKSSNYLITIRKSQIEATDVVYSILISLIVVFSLFGILLFLFNYYFSKKLWSPFLKTISTIKTLDINSSDIVFKSSLSQIQEFNELNDSLLQMINRIKSDFRRMKEFSENAAHELHTPLAIIRTKLESLLQSQNLKQEDALLINQALENTVRLSKLNQTLLLLTKIENHQYEEKKEIQFADLFTKFIELNKDAIEERQLEVDLKINENFMASIHPILADVLVSNLLSNSIKHNIPNGSISIVINRDGFKISNTGEIPEFPCESLFTRFKKGNHSSEHLGLGLALVKEIVEANNLKVHYIFDNKTHTLMVKKSSF